MRLHVHVAKGKFVKYCCKSRPVQYCLNDWKRSVLLFAQLDPL